MKLVEKWFWAICLAATLLGLFVPQSGAPLRPLIKLFLAGILFFSGLKLDFRAAGRELLRPALVVYAAAMMMIGLPLCIYGLALLALPASLAAGVLITAAMPAGLAGSSLTDIAKGNTALALVVILITSLACPLVSPWIIKLGTGMATETGWAFFGQQVRFLAMILFLPMAAAYAVRRMFPRPVARFKGSFTGLSMISLALLILSAMSDNSADFLKMLREEPGRVAVLTAFMFGFSAIFHVIGYFLAPWRPPADRAALSINAAYVNNGLAIVFATEFFKPLLGADAVLPAILLEVPMVLAILVLKVCLARIDGKNAALPSPSHSSPED